MGSRTNAAQLIIMISGAVLLFAGLGMTAAQLATELEAKKFLMSNLSGFNAGKDGFNFTTSYVGLNLAALGTILEIVGYVASRPWRSSKATDNE